MRRDTNMNDIVDTTTIRQLNDQLRQSLRGGLVVMTAGVRALSEARQLEVLAAVANFDQFDADNDPYGEHDFGAVELGRIGCSGKSSTTTRRSQTTRPIQRTRLSPSACSPSCWPRSTDCVRVRRGWHGVG